MLFAPIFVGILLIPSKYFNIGEKAKNENEGS
jgi:hypothetical protein